MPGAGPLMLADFPKLYALRLPFMKEMIESSDWPEADQQWQQFFDIQPSSKMREDFLELAGFGMFRQMGENDPVTYDQMIQGPSKSISHKLYGLGYQIGFLAAQFDMDGLIRRYAPALGRAQRVSIQTLAATFWNGAFDTETTPDGQTYFSNAHTFVRGGGTWSNRPAADTALGHAALETGLVAFNNQKDFEGNPMPLRAEQMLIPTALEPLAYELLNSTLRHDTTTHAKSFVSGAVRPVVWPFITISTAWMLLGPKSHRKVKWYWAVKPVTSHGFDFDKEAAKTKTLFACSYGALDGRGAYGSKGA